MIEAQRFCTFYIGDNLFGIPVTQVQEVIRHGNLRITRVPLAPQAVAGLMNLRGHIVMVVNLRKRFKMDCQQDGSARQYHVVVRTREGSVSLLVDRIGDVQEVGQDSFEPPPPTLVGVAKELVSNAYKLKDRLLLALNTDKTLEIT